MHSPAAGREGGIWIWRWRPAAELGRWRHDSGQTELQRRRGKAMGARLSDSVLVVVLSCSGRIPGWRTAERAVKLLRCSTFATAPCVRKS
jgi:hypothetical protein